MRVAAAAFTFALCVAAPAAAQETLSDPWEGFNRDLFAVHEGIDRAVLGPVARGYRAITPSPVRGGVRNFLHNLRSPVIFANDVLQGEPERAGVTAARFGVNTTIGVLGVFDPASHFGLERHDEDFGQTLGAWGVDAGPYLFVPVMGPTTVRDSFGRVVDMVFDPFTWADFEEIDTARAARGALSGLAARESLIEVIDDVRRTSLDPYSSFRTGYGLTRASAIQNGRTDAEDLPEFDDILDMPEDGVGEADPQHNDEMDAPAPEAGLAAPPESPNSRLQPGDTP